MIDERVNSRLAAERFVTGALRRIRIREKLDGLPWHEREVFAGSRRPPGDGNQRLMLAAIDAKHYS